MASTNSKNLATSTNSSDLTTSPNLANLKNSKNPFTLPAFNNPHSAAQRVKNHLAYKLGLAMMAYDTTTTGGGFSKFLLIPKLLFTLKNLKKLHKKQLQIYKEISPVFPQLKYPDLKTCSDYTDARLVKFHLAYLLGTALMKADKALFQGGYLRLSKDIKKAKQFYKNAQSLKALFEELNLSKEFLAEVLEQISNSEESNLSFEYFSGQGLILLKETLNLAQSFIYKENPIPNQVQKFILENLQVIHTWLTSSEFKEKYLNTNHPYPPLINPAKLNDENQKLNYHTIPAELAWEMNLPLPSGYKFILFVLAGTGMHATTTLLRHCGVTMTTYWFAIETQYIESYNFLQDKNNFVALPLNNNKKLLSLVTEKVPAICILRDPISQIKPYFNHHGGVNNNKIIREFSLNTTLDELFKVNIPYLFRFADDTGPNLEAGINFFSKDGERYFYLDFLIEATKDKITSLDFFKMDEIKPEAAYETLSKLADKFKFQKPQKNDILFKKNAGSQDELADRYFYPRKMLINLKNRQISLEILNYQNEDERLNFIGEFTQSDYILNTLKVGLYADKKDFEDLKASEQFERVRVYLQEYFKRLQAFYEKTAKSLITERQILDYMKTHPHILLAYKEIFDNAYSKVQKLRPDIVATWKYYAEFEEICKEFDKKDEKQEI